MFSLMLVSCGPSSKQQSTLFAVSFFSTLTAEASSNITLIPTMTPIPDLTANALSQIYKAATSQASWKTSLYDSFGNNVFDWCNDTSTTILDDGAKFHCHINNGVYQLNYTSGEKNPQVYVSPQGFYYDFNVSVLSKLINGDPETSYGIVFRAYQQDNKGLTRFIINPSFEYRIDTRDSNNNWIILQDWTKTNDLKPQGEWNKIAVIGVGPFFSFFINDKYQTSLTYNGADAGKGTIGLVVNSETPRKSIEVFFDDFNTREP